MSPTSEVLRGLQIARAIGRLVLPFVLHAQFAIAPRAAVAVTPSELYISISNAPLDANELGRLLRRGSVRLTNVEVNGDVQFEQSDSEPTTFRATNVTFNGGFRVSDSHLHLWFDGVKFGKYVDLYHLLSIWSALPEQMQARPLRTF
jgi:hypothetical protein